MLTAICKGINDDAYWFYEDDIDSVIEDIIYVVDDSVMAGNHTYVKSALYDDISGYNDALQDAETMLDNNELYLVKYYKYDGNSDLTYEVDYGLTKSEIIDNVIANKYIEGAQYWTIGSALKTTKDWLEGKLEY